MVWCDKDATDVDVDSDDLRNDERWGWVHRRAGRWHTITGTALLQTADGFTPLVISAGGHQGYPIAPLPDPPQYRPRRGHPGLPAQPPPPH